MHLLAGILLILTAILPTCFSSAQSSKSKLNQYNSNDKAHGRFVYYYDREKGIVHSTGRYKDGIPVGRWVTYHENGSKYIITRHYKHRARERRFYENGKIEKKGWSKLILDDLKGTRYYWDGKWKLYDENGILFRVLLFKEGRVINVIRNLNPKKEGIEMQ